MMHPRAARVLLALVVLVFLVVGTLYAVYTPAWQAPDEPAHYNYVAQIAGGGCCPVIAPGDWDTALINEVASREEPPPARLSRLEYEDHQPPLYYLLATPVFALTGGSLLALRLVSVVLGAGVVVHARQDGDVLRDEGDEHGGGQCQRRRSEQPRRDEVGHHHDARA
ncbi:MAG: hypothetical protein GX484_08920, partial [Chloroflexi bacterium]|nr:hypothetical protein [Chloroflexota bacterium]